MLTATTLFRQGIALGDTEEIADPDPFGFWSTERPSRIAPYDPDALKNES